MESKNMSMKNDRVREVLENGYAELRAERYNFANIVFDKAISIDENCADAYLGKALAEALGDKKGISRYGSMILPMDETLILSAVDISGRAYYASELNMRAKRVGDFDVELVDEFFQAFTQNASITLHIRQLAGRNTHHIIEGVFKSVARSLRAAVAIDERFADAVPSTKGVLG